MTRLLRRWFRCRRGQHRETLDMHPWSPRPMDVVIHTLRWRCVDCGVKTFCAISDNLDQLAGKIE